MEMYLYNISNMRVGIDRGWRCNIFFFLFSHFQTKFKWLAYAKTNLTYAWHGKQSHMLSMVCFQLLCLSFKSLYIYSTKLSGNRKSLPRYHNFLFLHPTAYFAVLMSLWQGLITKYLRIFFAANFWELALCG